MNKVIENRLKEINFNEIGARGIAREMCDLIVKYNLSINQADVTLDLAKDMLANRPLGVNEFALSTFNDLDLSHKSLCTWIGECQCCGKVNQIDLPRNKDIVPKFCGNCGEKIKYIKL